MLLSLTIRNFVLIEDAEMHFGPGLTVLTGETGAGKTLLTRALGLLVGERAEEGLVGRAADDASVQAVFDIDLETLADIPEEIRDLVSIEPGEVIVVS
jgi:DNA repair protein RecN (Recombination protein N)